MERGNPEQTDIRILEYGQLWLVSLAFLQFSFTYYSASISLRSSFWFPYQTLNLVYYWFLVFSKIFFLLIPLVCIPSFLFLSYSPVCRPYVNPVKTISNVNYAFFSISNVNYAFFAPSLHLTQSNIYCIHWPYLMMSDFVFMSKGPYIVPSGIGNTINIC